MHHVGTYASKFVYLKVVCESDLYHYSSKENFENFLGGDSIVETPVPIPNTEVKHYTPKILVWRRAGKIGTAKDYI
jgi:hypothetical protein